ncbi:unnamed protein product, partial [Rotaria sp. Silwood1]
MTDESSALISKEEIERKIPSALRPDRIIIPSTLQARNAINIW